MSDLPEDISHDQYAVRLKKLQDMRAAGSDPFRAAVEQTHFSAEALAAYVDGQDNTVPVKVAGRLVVIRDMGKSHFVKILDQQGQLQLYLKKDVVGDDAYAAFKKLDLGDIIGATGMLFKSKSGEITVRVEKYTLVAKALRPLPEKWHGLTDAEQVYRQRYLDLIVNPESRARLMLRSRIVASLRQTLAERKFLEVETPVLEGVAGGAAARPFVTHHNALGVDFFLRIALELRLKRLLVGGYDRVFEIGRIFRNEGISRKHNPEFTMLEVYQAYSDFRGMMELVKALFAGVCRDVLGTTGIKHAASGQVIDFAGEWREVRYFDLIDEAVGFKLSAFRNTPEYGVKALEAAKNAGFDDEEIWEWAPLPVDGIATPGLETFEIVNQIFSKKIEPTLIQPTFVTHLPKELCPLAKFTPGDDSTLDVFELIIGGMEIAPAYSEQNDPLAQREMFAQQVGADQQKMDTDFLLALEHGMPPAGGMGVGIDRLCILLTGAESIRDVILFPSLRPGHAGAGQP
jgi:lysyl-tRNA synthetase class 2